MSDRLSELRARNEQLDSSVNNVVRAAEATSREQEARLASLPAGVDALRVSRDLRRSETAASAGVSSNSTAQQAPAPEEELPPPVGTETAGGDESISWGSILDATAAAEDDASVRLDSCSAIELPLAPSSSSAAAPPIPAVPSAAPIAGGSGATPRVATPSPPAAAAPASGDDMGTEASLRYQKARLAVTLEELERLRGLLAEKTAAVADAEASVRELQQKTSMLSRSERSLQAALEKERADKSEGAKRADGLERELALLKRQSDESARREKTTGADVRSKDVRLNRALEELERTKAQLKQLRDEREGAGHGARAEAQRLAAENSKLRKRQSELVLAFKKQAKLIDVLKRQKLHVEAATLLSFTEAEFSKTLELGEQLALA